MNHATLSPQRGHLWTHTTPVHFAVAAKRNAQSRPTITPPPPGRAGRIAIEQTPSTAAGAPSPGIYIRPRSAPCRSRLEQNTFRPAAKQAASASGSPGLRGHASTLSFHSCRRYHSAGTPLILMIGGRSTHGMAPKALAPSCPFRRGSKHHVGNEPLGFREGCRTAAGEASGLPAHWSLQIMPIKIDKPTQSPSSCRTGR
jgi:hypothetical protein